MVTPWASCPLISGLIRPGGLLCRGLSWGLCVLLGAQPLLLQAAEITAAQSAAAGQRPVIERAANGVPLVQIATPTAAGLSHNRYARFNVGRAGVVLNNAAQKLQRSELAGLVQGNARLRASGPATVILNEVVSAHRSHLRGMLEVHGQSAHVIIANPHGLTCDGCGFINTPRVTLSSGRPEFDGQGAFKGLRVSGGALEIGPNGADLSRAAVFELLSRRITVHGPVATPGALKLIAGRNDYAYPSGLVTPLAPVADAPRVAIDAALLGGMTAGRIQIIATERGAGVHSAGPMAANAGELRITADGQLVLNRARAGQRLLATSHNAGIEVRDTLYAKGGLQLTVRDTLQLGEQAMVAAAGEVMLKAEAVTLGQGARGVSGLAAAGALMVRARRLAGAGQLAAGGTLDIEADEIDLNRAAASGPTALSAGGDLRLMTRTVSARNARIQSGGALHLKSAATLTLRGGDYSAGGGLLLTVQGDLTHSGHLKAQGHGLLTLGGRLVNTGTLYSGQTLTLQNLTGGRFGALRNRDKALIHGHAGLSLRAASLANAGVLKSGRGALALTIGDDLTNSGRIEAATIATLRLGGDLGNTGQLVGVQALTLESLTGGRFGALRNAGAEARIQGGGRLVIRAASLSNAGQIGAGAGRLSLELGGDLTNSGLLYAQTASLYRLDGTLTNTRGDLLAETDLGVRGLSGAYATAIHNRSGNIEAITGQLTLKARTLTNTRAVEPIPGQTRQTRTTRRGRTTTTVVTTRETLTHGAGPARLLAGGDMMLEVGTLTNRYSQIAANGNLTLNAETVTNLGRDLIETVETTVVTAHSRRYCARRIFGFCISRKTRHWTTTASNTSSATHASVYSTLTAGGRLTGTVSGYLSNQAVRGGAGQIGLASGARALAAPEVAPGALRGAVVSLKPLQIALNALLERAALFRPARAPAAPWLLETRSAFINPRDYLGSDYFLNRLGDYRKTGGYRPGQALRRFGDAYVETRLILDQLFALSGQRYLGNAASLRAMIQTLYDQALLARARLGLTFGVALGAGQMADLRHNLIWLEAHAVRGETVLVPRLYLARPGRVNLAGARIRAGAADLRVAGLLNTGALTSRSGLDVQARETLINRGGGLYAGGDIRLMGGRLLVNQSGRIQGRNVTLGAARILHDTAKTRDPWDNGYTDRLQQLARIEARGDLSLVAGVMRATGGQIQAEGAVTLRAGQALALGPLELARDRRDAFQGGYDLETALGHEPVRLKAGRGLTLTSGGSARLYGVRAMAGGDLRILAQGELRAEGVQEQSRRDVRLDIKTGGLLGVETNIREQAAQSTTRATTLKAGGALTLASKAAGLTLRAVSLQSTDAATLEAPEGRVSLLAKTDTDYVRKQRREADLLWWNERDQGQFKETVRPVEVEAGGGLRIQAGRGVVIEYHKTGDLRASLGQLAEAPGLGWIAPLQADPRVEWRGVAAAFRDWDYEQSGLTEAGAALVALVTAVATGGMDFSQLLTSGALSGMKATAFNAGMQALTVNASVALVNNQGDLGATLRQLAATDTLRALATAMVTAGLTAHLEQAAGLGGELTRTAQYMERGLIRATVRAGVGTALQGGSLDENFIRALRLEAAHTLGEVAARNIGAEVDANDLGTASRLIAHAALGCVVGAVASDECGSGAVGGVTGEAVGLMTRARLAEWLQTRIRDARAGKVTPARILTELKAYRDAGIDVARLASGLAVAVAGGDVATAAFAGGNAAEHNALCGGICIGVVAALIGYVSYSGDGDLGEGLAAIGAGQDPLSRAVSAGAARSVRWSSTRYPDITAAVLGALEATGGAIEATITYVDDKTGQRVSRRWNELPEHTRNQIKGGMTVASFLLPAASVDKLGQYAKTGKLPDATKVTGNAANIGKADKSTVNPKKFDFLFGRSASSVHNANRSKQLALEMKRLGISDSTAGRKILSDHLDDVVKQKDNILKTFNNKHGNFEIRDSLLIGPSGKAIRLQSTFQIMLDGSRRFITTIPKR